MRDADDIDLTLQNDYRIGEDMVIEGASVLQDMVMGPDNLIYVLQQNGKIYRFDPLTLSTEIVHESIAGSTSYGIALDDQGLIYVSGVNRLTRIDPTSGETETFTAGITFSDVAVADDGRIDTRKGLALTLIVAANHFVAGRAESVAGAAKAAEAVPVLPVVQGFGVGQDARMFGIHSNRVAAQIGELGVNYMVLGLFFGTLPLEAAMHTLDRFAAEVMPALSEL